MVVVVVVVRVVCAVGLSNEGEGRKRANLRRLQRASSHRGRTRERSRGRCWRPAGQPPGASCHPSRTAEPSDPIYQEGTHRTERTKKKKIDGDEVSKARTPGMHGLTPKPIATKEPVAAMAVGVVAPPHGRRSATF